MFICLYEVTERPESTLNLVLHLILADSLWIGKCKTPLAFDSISPIRKGCEVILKQLAANHYKGTTGERSCESSLERRKFYYK